MIKDAFEPPKHRKYCLLPYSQNHTHKADSWHKTKSVVTDENFYIYFTEISASKSQMAEELALEASMNEEELERITEQARDRVEQQEAKNLALFAQCQTQKLKLGKSSRENSELKDVCERFSAVRSQLKQYRYL